MARLLRDQQGAIAMILALALPLLLGFTALAVEAGLWYAIKTQNQSAVDSAALTGAIALSQNSSADQIAQQVAFDAHANSANVDPTQSATYTTTCPPSSPNQICAVKGCWTPGSGFSTTCTAPSVANTVQVQLSQQVHTTFADLFTMLVGAEKSTLALNTKATAGLQALLGKGGACMNTNGTISISGSTTLTLPNCGILSFATNCPQPASNLAVSVNGNSATLTAGAIISRGCVGATGTSDQIIVPTGSILQQVSSSLMPQRAFTDSSGNPPSDPYYQTSSAWPSSLWTGTVQSSSTTSTSATIMFTTTIPTVIQNLLTSTLRPVTSGVSVSDTTNSGRLDGTTVVTGVSSTTLTLASGPQANQNPFKNSGVHNGDTLVLASVPTISWTTGTLILYPGLYQGLSVSGGTVSLHPGTYYLSNSSNWKCTAGNNGDGFCVSGGTVQQVDTSGQLVTNPGTIEIVFDALNLNITGGAFSLPSATMLLTKQSTSGSVGSITITNGTGTMTAPRSGATACTSFTSSGCSFSSPATPPIAFTSTAPETVNGMLIYQNPGFSGKNTISVEGGSGSCSSSTSLILFGAIDSGYGSAAEDDISGNGSSACGTCTELIAGSFKYSGNVALDTSGCTDIYGQIAAQIFGIGLVE